VEREHVVAERILGVARAHERGGRKTDGYCDEVVIWMSRCGWVVLHYRWYLLSLVAPSSFVDQALVSGNSSVRVGFVVVLVHSESRPF
jgi:hypothetical protein